MVDALKFDRKQIGDVLHPSTVKPVLFACFLDESGRRGKLHPSFDDHGRSLTKPLGFGIVKANGDDVWKGLTGGLGFSPSSQENASRAGANAPNPCLAVGGPLGKDEDVTAPWRVSKRATPDAAHFGAGRPLRPSHPPFVRRARRPSV